MRSMGIKGAPEPKFELIVTQNSPINNNELW